MSGLAEAEIAQAVHGILGWIGEDPDREGLRDTPGRVARAWLELTAGYHEEPADHLDRQFDAEHYSGRKEAGGIVLVRDIPFYSMCEHHMIPFHGVCHVGYVPVEKVPGLSKVARCVKGYAARLQLQERLTNQIADAMNSRLDPVGVAVVCKAEHLCMGMRGVRVDGAVTVTSAMRGIFFHDAKARDEILKLMED